MEKSAAPGYRTDFTPGYLPAGQTKQMLHVVKWFEEGDEFIYKQFSVHFVTFTSDKAKMNTKSLNN